MFEPEDVKFLPRWGSKKSWVRVIRPQKVFTLEVNKQTQLFFVHFWVFRKGKIFLCSTAVYSVVRRYEMFYCRWPNFLPTLANCFNHFQLLYKQYQFSVLASNFCSTICFCFNQANIFRHRVVKDNRLTVCPFRFCYVAMALNKTKVNQVHLQKVWKSVFRNRTSTYLKLKIYLRFDL